MGGELQTSGCGEKKKDLGGCREKRCGVKAVLGKKILGVGLNC